MRRFSIFNHKKSIERRTNQFYLRPHESRAGYYRVIRIRDNKPMAEIEGLRRAEDLAIGMENYEGDSPVSEHDQKRRRVEKMIKARIGNWKSDDEQAA